MAANELGARVLVLDMDPQKTAESWYQARESPTPKLAAVTAAERAPVPPGAPRSLKADGKDEAVVLSWKAPASGGSAITDYEYRIGVRGDWISIGSTQTTYTVTGLVNGTAYVFQVRAVSRIGKSRDSNRAEATAGAVLDFAHFANGTGITSGLVFVNVSPHLTRPALYFYDQGGDLIDPASVVDLTGDLVVAEDGSLTVHTEMEPLGQLTISTHGREDLVSGSVRVVSGGPIGGMLRFDHPEVGVCAARQGCDMMNTYIQRTLEDRQAWRLRFDWLLKPNNGLIF